MSETHKNSRINELEIEKKELEIEKIKQENEKISLEIGELKKSSFKKTNWAAILIPLSLTIVPVIYLLFSGIFDSKYQEYRANKATLELDQKNFAVIRDSIYFKIQEMNASLDSVKGLLSKKTDSLILLSSGISLAKKQIDESNKIKESLNQHIENRDKKMGEILNEKQKNEKKLNDSIKNINHTVTGYEEGFRMMKMNTEQSKSAIKALIYNLEFNLKERNIRVQELEGKIKILEEKLRPNIKN